MKFVSSGKLQPPTGYVLIGTCCDLDVILVHIPMVQVVKFNLHYEVRNSI